MYDFYPSWRSPNYYFFPSDIEKYPDADIFLVFSRRGPGKTYSALRWAYEQGICILYVKRTIKDIHILCTSRGSVSLDPYVPINRDTGYNITASEITEGIGAFYDHVTEEGKPEGAPFSYCAALNAMKTLKGFDLSQVDWLLIDEFIPLPGEKVQKAEGEQLLSVYMTLARDRALRGRPPLKLIMFANAENISTPITNELEVVDDMVNLQASGKTHRYIEDRGILIHHITEDEIPIAEDEKESGLYRAMKNTTWFLKAYGGSFASNDFSKVKRTALKSYVPRACYIYKNKEVYIYQKGPEFFLTYSKSNRVPPDRIYDFQQESEQKRFFFDIWRDIRESEIAGQCTYESYTMYDLMTNYKQFFKI